MIWRGSLMEGLGWDPSFAKAAAASAATVSGQVIQDDMMAGVCPEISAVVGRMTSPQPLAARMAGCYTGMRRVIRSP